jgi:sulfate adenylyltransferase
VVGRDHAGPSYKKKDGSTFFEPYAAQELLKQYECELPIKIITSVQIVYVKELEDYRPIDCVPAGNTILNISGTRQRALLEAGEPLPEWFTFPEMSRILKQRYPTKRNQGLCIYFVGLSGAGKSTLANFLLQRLCEQVERRVSLLDGDLVRQNLSKGLGFSREDRSTNVRRVGWVASEIVKHQGVCVCATIAPYTEDRNYNRQVIEKWGNYVEIWVDTPLAVCEDRDIKGLYQLAREGKINHFTGINDPFEIPATADLRLDSSDPELLDYNISKIMNYLNDQGMI